jgi:predicted PurR-regulated permease PerM
MEETKKIAIVIASAIVGSIIGLGFKGVFGAIMGFILTLIVIKLFSIWKNYRE